MSINRFAASLGVAALVAGPATGLSAAERAPDAAAYVEGALAACELWVGGGDMEAARAAGTATDFIVIGPGGSWIDGGLQKVRFAMSSPGAGRECEIRVLAEAAKPEAVVGWVRTWMADAGYVDPHLNGPPAGRLLEATSFTSMSGRLEVVGSTEGGTTVNLISLGY